jgi:hypothetical protein
VRNPVSIFGLSTSTLHRYIAAASPHADLPSALRRRRLTGGAAQVEPGLVEAMQAAGFFLAPGILTGS